MRRVVLRREEEPPACPHNSMLRVVRRVRYRECRRNHACRYGGHVVDGCREFIARGEEGGAALACATCGCHRSFHWREEQTQLVCTCPVHAPPNNGA